MGSTPEGASEVISACRPVTKRPLLVKMAPERIGEVARACEAAGADALTGHQLHPPPWPSTCARARAACRVPTGGLSGPCLHPIAVRMAWEACNAVSIPVCGVGGITSGEDAAEFILAGCTAVSVGMQSLVEPGAALRVARELEQWAEEQGASDICELKGALEC